MALRGAERSPVWRAFVAHTRDSGVPEGRVRCRFCAAELSLNATRLAEHLKSGKCRAGSSAEAGNGPSRADVLARMAEFQPRNAPKRPAAAMAADAAPKHSRQRTLSFGPSQTTADEANTKLMFLLAGESLPLSIVDSPLFRDFVDALLRGVRTTSGKKWQVPCRQTIADTILPRSFQELDAKRREEVLAGARHTGVTISVDGKTSKAQHTSLLKVVAQTPKGTVVLDIQDVSGKTKDKDFIINFVVSAITRELEMYGGVFAVNEVVMDGANRHCAEALTERVHRLRLAKDITRTKALPPLQTSTCVAHSAATIQVSQTRGAAHHGSQRHSY